MLLIWSVSVTADTNKALDDWRAYWGKTNIDQFECKLLGETLINTKNTQPTLIKNFITCNTMLMTEEQFDVDQFRDYQ